MADGEVNFSINTTSGPVDTTTYPRDDFLDTLRYLQFTDPGLRAIDSIPDTDSFGIWAFDNSGTCAARTISGTNGLSVTNGDGVSGNPTVGINNGWSALQAILSTPDSITSGGQTVSVTAPVTILSGFTSPTTCTIPQAPAGEVNFKVILNNTGVTITCNEDSGSLDGSAITLPDKALTILVSNESQVWNRLV